MHRGVYSELRFWIGRVLAGGRRIPCVLPAVEKFEKPSHKRGRFAQKRVSDAVN